MDFSNDNITVRTEDASQDAGFEKIPCSYNGDDVCCAMNYTYLLSPMKVMESEDVRIEFTDPGRPFTLKCEPERDYLHVIMPMSV